MNNELQGYMGRAVVRGTCATYSESDCYLHNGKARSFSGVHSVKARGKRHKLNHGEAWADTKIVIIFTITFNHKGRQTLQRAQRSGISILSSEQPDLIVSAGSRMNETLPGSPSNLKYFNRSMVLVSGTLGRTVIIYY